MNAPRCICSFVSLAALLVLVGTASATDLSVDCDAGESLQAALNSLDLIGPHTITVTGTCQERITVRDRGRLTIQAPVDQTATITSPTAGVGLVLNIDGARGIVLRRLTISGGLFGVSLRRASEVLLQGCVIESNTVGGLTLTGNSMASLGGSRSDQFVRVSNNGGEGISASGSNDLSLLGFVTVENNGQHGLNLSDGTVAFVTATGASENIIRANATGGVLVSGGSVRFGGQNMIQNNGFFGVQVVGAATAGFLRTTLPDGTLRATTIEGHTVAGVDVFGTAQAFFFGPHKIRNNGSIGEPRSSGIALGDSASIRLLATPTSGTTEVSNNVGAGILADPTATVRLDGSMISNNTGDGVRLLHLSVAAVSARLPAGITTANTIAGNGGAAIACDTTSLVFGDLTGISPIQCANVERTPASPGPPMPPAPVAAEPPEPPNP